MKALQLTEPKTFETIDLQEPEQPGLGQALVQVHRIGICGTDYSGYLGKMPFFSYPRIPGHELGVEVLAVGSNVSNVKTGDHCSVEPYMNCGNCYPCRKGASNCCESLKVIGVMEDGGMRERFLIRAEKLHTSQKLAFDQLALVETLAIGCHANDRGAPSEGEHVLIIGAGPIGLATLEFTRLTGAKITVMDMVQTRLDFCKSTYGVDHTGSLVYVGITTEAISFKHPMLHKPEITLKASRNALPKDFGRIIGLIEDGTIDTAPWVTHRTAFDAVAENFEGFTRPETGVIKAIIEMC